MTELLLRAELIVVLLTRAASFGLTRPSLMLKFYRIPEPDFLLRLL